MAMRTILDYLQHGELRLCHEHVHSVLHAAHQFQIHDVIEGCEIYLCQLVNTGNIMEILDLADHYSAARLLKQVYSIIRNHFIELSYSIKETLVQLKFDQLYALLESNLPIKASEFEIFNLVSKWVRKDLANRAIHLSALLSVIKIPLMSIAELTKLSRTQEAWLRDSPAFKEELAKSFKYKNHIHEQPLLQTWQTSPRGMKPCLLAFSENDAILVEGHTLECHLVTFNDDSVEVVSHDFKLAWQRDEYSIVVWKNFLYVAGGFDPVSNCNLSLVHRYDPAIDSWVRVQQMMQRRSSFFLGTIGDQLCAVGGRQYDQALYNAFNMYSQCLMSVELYDCHRDSWHKAASLPSGSLYAHAGAECMNQLYICGGRRDDSGSPQDTNDMHRYDSTSDTWTKCPSMFWHRYHHAMISLCDKLYVFGGLYFDSTRSYNSRWNFVSDVESFDPLTNQWTDIRALSSMPHRRSQLGVAAMGNKIYIFGGLPYPGVDGRQEVLEFNVEANQWRSSMVTYPTLWPTVCCVLSVKPDFSNKTLEYAPHMPFINTFPKKTRNMHSIRHLSTHDQWPNS